MNLSWSRSEILSQIRKPAMEYTNCPNRSFYVCVNITRFGRYRNHQQVAPIFVALVIMANPAFTFPIPISSSSPSSPSLIKSLSPFSPPFRYTSFLPRSPRHLSPVTPLPTSTVPPLRTPALQMSLSKVVIAGGTGFIGSNLAKALASRGSAVIVLTRNPSSSSSTLPSNVTLQKWDPQSTTTSEVTPWADTLTDADLVVNLCGHPVVSRWDDAGRDRIISSRINSTRVLVNAVKRLPQGKRPKCLISASAIGYYGMSRDAVFDEDSSAPSQDFLAQVCVQWEHEVEQGMKDLPDVRVAIVRIGVVMGVGGGALEQMLPVFKMFLGGPVGSGEQWVSWVHVDDLVRVFMEIGENERMKGVFNAAAPNAVNMKELTQALAKALGRPNLFPVPAFALKLLYGEGANVVLEGQHVVPKRLVEAGFEFKHESIQSAMKAVAEEA